MTPLGPSELNVLTAYGQQSAVFIYPWWTLKSKATVDKVKGFPHRQGVTNAKASFYCVCFVITVQLPLTFPEHTARYVKVNNQVKT